MPFNKIRVCFPAFTYILDISGKYGYTMAKLGFSPRGSKYEEMNIQKVGFNIYYIM